MRSMRVRSLTVALGGLVAVLGILVLSTETQAAPAGWTENLKVARAAAEKAGRPILINFTGSDWCPYCKLLANEVFYTADFQKWAKENVVLMEADFPARGSQSEALKAQNEALKNKYDIKGYPTVVFIDAEGNELGRSGYRKGGPEPWIKHAQAVLDSAPKPVKLEPMDSLVEARKQALESGKPLLVIATDRRSEKAYEALKDRDSLVRLIDRRLVTVRLELPVTPETDEGRAYEELVTSQKLPRGRAMLAVIDYGGGDEPTREEPRLLHKETRIPSALLLERDIKKVLPPMKYDGQWLVDLEEARAIAESLDRPVFALFTGSDWCIWCKRLDSEILETDTFKDYAKRNLVLVKLDFPKRIEQAEEVKARNERWSQQYGVRGFPTIVLLSPDGNKTGQMGYMKGGPEPFLSKLKQELR